MKLRTVLIIIISSLAIIIGGGYFMLTRFLNAVGEKCDIKIIAKINSYEVKDKSCIGFAGPRYSQYYLYENGQNIGVGQRLDSCSIRFTPKHLILDFNICSNQLTKSKREIKNLDQ